MFQSSSHWDDFPHLSLHTRILVEVLMHVLRTCSPGCTAVCIALELRDLFDIRNLATGKCVRIKDIPRDPFNFKYLP